MGFSKMPTFLEPDSKFPSTLSLKFFEAESKLVLL